ncbi:MAG: ABC transporter permease [Bacteroidaceae bacterium]|nr:ABC transporter permease [Bacteroidaceae bacterium]
MKKFSQGAVGIIAFIVFWQVLCAVKQDPALISIEKIFNSLVNIVNDKRFYANLLSTLKIVLSGIIVAIVFGMSAGILMDINESIKNIFSPIVEMFRNIPSITLFPILLVIYGIGDTARIFIIFWTASPAIILATTYGLRMVDRDVVEAAQSAGADSARIMMQIKLPLAMPEILNGIKIGIGSGFVAIVVAEMLGATRGLGYMVLWSTNSFKYSETYAYILIIALVGAIVNLMMNIIIKIYEVKVL